MKFKSHLIPTSESDLQVALVKVADVTPLDDEARALSHEELMEAACKHLRENGAPAR